MSFTKIDHYEREYRDAHHDSALNVTAGVEDQPMVNRSEEHTSELQSP